MGFLSISRKFFLNFFSALFALMLYMNANAQQIISGADMFNQSHLSLIKGKKVGLVSNHSGRLSSGEHLADVLFKTPDVTLKVLFGMEYNIRTNDYSLTHDEEKSIDKQTGVPKYSLYGAIHKPTKEMLDDIDVMIFDIQEIGIRFYEHVNILGFVMEACAENNVDLIVLDRPNPLNGLVCEGFVTNDEYLYSFGSFGKIPIRHGMTMGELANLYNGEKMLRNGVKTNVTVIKMKGWERKMWFEQTGVEWRKPSPNLITISSVLTYTGTCIFEGLNVSEGRGTDKPFEYIGAPWLNNKEAIKLLNSLKLPGVTFEAIEFVPEKKVFLGRPPEMNGELCKGIYIKVNNRNLFEPYYTGVSLLWAINKLHAEKLIWKEPAILRLSGTDRLLKMIKNGSSPEKIKDSWSKELKNYKTMRTNYYLYQ